MHQAELTDIIYAVYNGDRAMADLASETILKKTTLGKNLMCLNGIFLLTEQWYGRHTILMVNVEQNKLTTTRN